MTKYYLNMMILLLSAFAMTACIDTMELPVVPDDEGYVVIGQDDEKYIEVMPRWDEEFLGFSDLTDMYCAADGRFYIADSSASAIHVIQANGQKENGLYETLDPLLVDSMPIRPLAVCVDSRFMVYFTDGGENVYAWHRYLAGAEIESLIDSVQIEEDGATRFISPYDLNFLSGDDYSLRVNVNIADSSAERIDSIRKPYAFFNPKTGINKSINPVYAGLSHSYRSLAPSEAGALHLFVNDHKNDYILKLNFMIRDLIKLKNGQYLFTYTGIFGGFPASKGTGSGTVSDVTGMSSDQSGNLFYTQFGEYFSVHKLKAGTYGSQYNLGENEIMELDRFDRAMDVAVDSKGNVFVLDAGLNEVMKFNAAGDYIRSLAITETWVKEGDSLALYTENDVMKDPRVIAAYDEIIYIGDNGNKRILRYTLADDVSIELPVD